MPDPADILAPLDPAEPAEPAESPDLADIPQTPADPPPNLDSTARHQPPPLTPDKLADLRARYRI